VNVARYAVRGAVEADACRPLPACYTGTMTESRWSNRLIVAGYLFAFGSAIHLVDHLRRGQGSVTETLFWAGNLALIVQVLVITLVITRHRAAAVAALAAFPLAIGFIAAHWMPTWSALSDSFVSNDASWFSYVASLAEIFGALAVGMVGVMVLRDQRDERAGSLPRAPRLDDLAHGVGGGVS